MSYSGAARNGKLHDAARKAEEESSHAKRKVEECVRREECTQEEKEERDRKAKERDHRREWEKRKNAQYYSRRHKDSDD